MNTSFSETRRQVVHIATGGFALFLRVLTWWQAAALASAAFCFNLWVLPRIGGQSLHRTTDRARGYAPGILFYPLSLLLLILIFPRRLDIVAAAWGILAVGDGVATLAGRWIAGPRLPWNRDKSLAGSLAFVAGGATAGSALAWWTAPAVTPVPPLAFVLLAPALATVAAAAIETIPVRLDDNLSVPATAAAVLWASSLVDVTAWNTASPHVSRLLGPAILVNGTAAWLAWWARAVSPSGAVAGGVLGTIVFAAAGLRGWTLLCAMFAAASLSSRLGLRRKIVLGIAEERGGRRGAGNAIANTIVGTLAALLGVLTPARDVAHLAMVAALVAAGSDTVASEVGKAWGGRAFLVTSLSRARPGTSGAVSVEGTGAGVLAALALGALGLALGLIGPGAVLIVVVAATAASLVESVLGATLEGPGILNNDLLNFVNTACAAGLAAGLAGFTG